MVRIVALLLGLGLTLATGLQAQDRVVVRICTYNLLQFGADDVDRTDEFRRILQEIRPTILVVQEISTRDSTEGYALFRDSVTAFLNGPFVGLFSPDTTGSSQNAVFVDTTAVEVLAYANLEQVLVPRAQLLVGLRIKGAADTIVLINGHWKAGSTNADEDDRELTAQTITLAAEAIQSGLFASQMRTDQFIVAGDLNVYSSNEPGYRVLLTGFDDRHPRFYDPIDRPGDWHNNSVFAEIHTQATRTRQFGGGVNGGVDDRFDQILVTAPLLDNVLPATYTAFGNDGDHFNDSINAMPNMVVSSETAQALHDASDHLPVYVDFVFGATSNVDEARQARKLELTVTPSPAMQEE